MSVIRFSVTLLRTSQSGQLLKNERNMQAEAEQYSQNVLKNWMILSLNILVICFNSLRY